MCYDLDAAYFAAMVILIPKGGSSVKEDAFDMECEMRRQWLPCMYMKRNVSRIEL